MARPAQITRQNLAPLLMMRGPVSATDLAAALRVNRTTIVRALEDFGEELMTFGATRSTRYALRRNVLNAGNSWPLHVLDEAGRARPWGTLEALHDQRWRVTWDGPPPDWAGHFITAAGLWDGFPFFLADVRPQGFLGRAIARRMARALAVPEDPRQWSDEHTLLYLQAAGDDLPGALVVGDECLRRAQARAFSPDTEHTVSKAARAARYPQMAQEAVSSLPESSAGGEQPKFLTTVTDAAGGHSAVLVKFSPPLEQPTGRRWADLLVCESLAHEVLSGHGLARAGAQILDAAGRRFLEVPRFDRAGAGGRRGVVSLGALHPEALGISARTAWPAATEELRRCGLINEEAADTIVRLHAFGELIGNTDMHAGNLAFWLEPALPFRVAPAYDMLPMLWAPGAQGEIADRTFAPAPPLPAVRPLWREAAAWAAEFWNRVVADARVSAEFVSLAQSARTFLQRLRDHTG